MYLLRCYVVICVISTGLIAADNPFLGTWKLNLAKSKYSPGAAPNKELTVKFEADGEKVSRTVTGVQVDGKALQQGPDSIMWDGQDHPIQGSEGATIAVERINSHTNQITIKQDGKPVVTVRSVVSKDGSTMTNTLDGVNPKGEKILEVEVLEKQ